MWVRVVIRQMMIIMVQLYFYRMHRERETIQAHWKQDKRTSPQRMSSIILVECDDRALPLLVSHLFCWLPCTLLNCVTLQCCYYHCCLYSQRKVDKQYMTLQDVVCTLINAQTVIHSLIHSLRFVHNIMLLLESLLLKRQYYSWPCTCTCTCTWTWT
jgi:hypothetical protein